MSSVASLLRSIAGKSVLVTGGGSGLGEATARYLAKNGAMVTILDVTEKGKEVADAIGGKYVCANVTNEEEVSGAIRAATDVFGPLFAAVNCAGIVLGAKVVGKRGACSLQDFKRVINVNLVGTFNVCRLAAEAMVSNDLPEAEERGVIVNTASIAAYEGQIGQAAYAASKSGIVGLTLPLARDLAPHRIRVNTVCPGVMATPLLGQLPASVLESLGKTVPYPHRLGDPMEFAALVHHIIVNGYINGECIRLDGALRMPPK